MCHGLVQLVREVAEPIASQDLDDAPIDALIERIGDARLVLLGESTHGTGELYRTHDTGVPAFFLHLRAPHRDEVRAALEPPRLERAIGAVYRPERELASHYFEATLPHQFDELVWIDETRAVQ